MRKLVSESIISLLEDFKSNCREAVVRYSFQKLGGDRIGYWESLPDNDEIYDMLNSLVSGPLGYRSIGDKWTEHKVDEARDFLVHAMSHCVNGFRIWDEEKALDLFDLISEGLGQNKRYFCNSRPKMQFAEIACADPREPNWENGIAFYGKKMKGCIWVSMRNFAWDIFVPPSDRKS